MPRKAHERESGLPFGLVAMLFAGAAGLNFLAGAAVHAVVESGFEGKVPFVRSATQISLIDEAEAKEEEDEKDQDERDESSPQSLVDLDRVTEERAPEDAEYAAEFDNQSELDTRRPMHGGASQAGQSPQPSQRGQSGQASGAQGVGGQASQPSAAPERQAGLGEQARGDGERGIDAPAQGEVSTAAAGASASSPAGAGGQPSAPSLSGSSTALAETFGLTPSYDPTESLGVGSENDMDTKRHRFASFYNRIRQGVYQHWHPDQVMTRLDPDSDKYAPMARTTRLLIRLLPDGELDRVRLIQSSGIDQLDEEAIRSIRRAAPFTNPPAELVDETSQRIRIDLGFTLHPSGEFTVVRE